MAGSDKITHRIDTGRDSAQSAQSVSEASSGTKKKSLKERDAEWGYEPAKGGMAIEAKMGMGIVVILICAFSFLVYHKFDLRQKALNLAQKAKTKGDVPLQNSDGTAMQDQLSEFHADDRNVVTASLNSPLDAANPNAAPPLAREMTNPLAEDVNIATTAATLSSADEVNAAPQFDLEEPTEPFVQPAPDNATTEDVLDVLAAADARRPKEFETTGLRGGIAESFGSDSVDDDAVPPAETGENSSFSEFGATQATVAADPAPTKPTPTFSALDVATNSTASEQTESLPSFETAPAFEEPQVFTSLPPASEVESFTDTELGKSTQPLLPPADTPKAAVHDALSDSAVALAPAEDVNPLATDTPDSKPITEELVLSTFGNETTISDDDFPSSSEPAPAEFPDFTRTFPLDATTDKLTQNRRNAPLPEFPLADVTPAPSPSSSPLSESQTSPQALPDSEARRDTLVALSTPSPDVDVFSSDTFPSDSTTANTTVPPVRSTIPTDVVSPGTRTFGADQSSFDPFSPNPQAQSPPKPVVDTTPTPAPAPTPAPTTTPVRNPAPFSGFDTTPDLALPATAADRTPPQEGVARFLIPAATGIQQVAGISQECDICEVQPKDNYWTISKRAYGTSRYFSSLALFNQQRVPDPRKLRPGMKVLIPDPKLLEQKYPEFFKDRQSKPRQQVGFFVQANGTPAYRIGERETLSEISQKHLGRASRWIQIYRMNQHILKDPNKLKPGTVIALPDDANSVHLAP